MLNSTLLRFVFAKRHVDVHIKGAYLARVPMPAVDSEESVEARKRAGALVARRLKLKPSGAVARANQERPSLSREAESVDDALDQLVYRLFGLADDETALVESAD